MTRDSRRADDLVPGVYIWEDGVMHLLVFRLPLAEDQLLVLATGQTVTHRHDVMVELAGADEVFEASAVAQASGRGLRNFPGLSPAIGPVREVFGPMYYEAGITSSPWTGCGRCGALDQVPNGMGLCGECEAVLALRSADEMRAAEDKPLPYGFAVSDGHRPQVDDDVMRADRYSGEG